MGELMRKIPCRKCGEEFEVSAMKRPDKDAMCQDCDTVTSYIPGEEKGSRKIPGMCTCGEGGKHAVYHDSNCPRGQEECRDSEALDKAYAEKVKQERAVTHEDVGCVNAKPDRAGFINGYSSREPSELEKIKDLIDGVVGPDYFNWEKLPGRVAAVINEYVVKNCQEKHDAFSKDNYSHVEPAEPSFRQEVEDLSKNLSLDAVRSDVSDIYNLLNDDPDEELSIDVFVGNLRALRIEKDDLESKNAGMQDDVNRLGKIVLNSESMLSSIKTLLDLEELNPDPDADLNDRVKKFLDCNVTLGKKIGEAHDYMNGIGWNTGCSLGERVRVLCEVYKESKRILDNNDVLEESSVMYSRIGHLAKEKSKLLEIIEKDNVLHQERLEKLNKAEYKASANSKAKSDVDRLTEYLEYEEKHRSSKQNIKYLAAPYSHENKDMMEARFNMINMATASLLKSGHHIYSPISHNHHMAQDNEMPTGFEFWRKYDTAMISVCSELFVLKMPGWEESTGVQAEIKIAEELDIPVRYINFGFEIGE